MRLFGLFLVVVVLGTAPAKAGEAPPPFELPVVRNSQTIPQGLGIRFFQGEWEYVGRSGGFHVTVTDKAFINQVSGIAKPYRVLVEARNYVLLALLMRTNFKTFPNIPWTNFVVLTLSHYEGGDPYSKYGFMRYHSCNDESMDGGEHAFSWSKEKLMRIFRASCLAGIAPKDKLPFGEGWTRSHYQWW